MLVIFVCIFAADVKSLFSLFIIVLICNKYSWNPDFSASYSVDIFLNNRYFILKNHSIGKSKMIVFA